MLANKFHNLELLAPAGDILALKAALIAGADSVYLGGKNFGARGFAPNFDEKSLRWARRVTKSAGKKLYITLNTLVFDREFPFLEKTLDFYESLQPDALIVQDLGVASLLNKRKSAIPRHLSTQGGWDGNGGLEILKELGFSRVILPRECSLVQIQKICQNSGLEIEVFVHGAMCYSVSGKCFWSASLGERSGNRGTCAQPCRKSYRTKTMDNGFYFSPKDLRLAGSIEDLRSAGVSCLKIEGRMKDAEYVFNVVGIYRRLIDVQVFDEKIDRELNAVISRPAHSGFIKGFPEADWYTKEGAGRHGMNIGTVHSKRRPDGLIEILACYPLKMGDGVAWKEGEKKNGGRLTWVEKVGTQEFLYAVRGIPDLPVGTGLTLTDSPSGREWLSSWQKDWERIPIDLFWSGFEGQHLAVEAVFNEKPVRILSQEALSRSKGCGLETGPLEEKFSNIGELFRVTRHVTKALEKGLFLSPTSLKKLKRELLETLSRLEGVPLPGRNTSFPKDGEVGRFRRTGCPSVGARPGGRFCPDRPDGEVFKDPLVPVSSKSSDVKPSFDRLEDVNETLAFPFESEDAAFPMNKGNYSNSCTKSEISRPIVTIRLWRAKDFPGAGVPETLIASSRRGGASPDRWLFPIDEPPPETIPPQSIGFWIPQMENPEDLTAVIDKLENLPDQEFLCMGWEIFELARRIPRHSYRLDWAFNLANTEGLRYFILKGFAATSAREWPPGKPPTEPNVVWQIPWNPLVSFSRFRPDLDPAEMIYNPHGDAFFIRRSGQTTLLFLKNKPAKKLPVPKLPIQIDFALAPDETPQKVLPELRDFISEVKKTAAFQS